MQGWLGKGYGPVRVFEMETLQETDTLQMEN